MTVPMCALDIRGTSHPSQRSGFALPPRRGHADRLTGAARVILEKGDQGIRAKEVWKAMGFPSWTCTPVVAGDRVFGFSEQRNGRLFCLDARTGETLWQSDGRLGSYGSILNAGSVWLVLTDRGQLIVVKPSGTAYEPIAQYRVSDSQTWAHPVFLGDRILIKDEATLRSLAIGREEAVP